MSEETKRLADDNMRRIDAWNQAAGERPDAIPGCPEHPGPPIPQAAVEAMVRAATGPAGFDDGHTDCYYRGLIAAALPFLGAAHPEAGSEEVERLRTELERARARDANLHKRVRERLGQIHGKGYSFVEAMSDLERLATHPVWEQAEQATVDLERAEAEAERLDERARINARYAGKLSAERDEARAEADRLVQTQRELITERNAARTEVERLRDAARAFVRETGAAHPAIARIPADAPAAVRYDETRAALLALLDAHPEADRAPEDCAVCGGTGGGAAGMCPACGGTGHEADRAPDHDPACVLPHGHSGLCQAAPSSEADRAPETRAGQEEQWDQGSSGVGETDRAPEDEREFSRDVEEPES